MSITKEQILQFLENPQLMNERTRDELKEILDEFPYFQTAHMLYVKNLHQLESYRFDIQLKRSAIAVTNRNRLHQYLFPKEQAVQESAAQLVEQNNNQKGIVQQEAKTSEKLTETFLELADETRTPPVKQSDLPVEKPREKSSRFDLLDFDLGETAHYQLESADTSEAQELGEIAEAINKKETSENQENKDLIDEFIQKTPQRIGKDSTSAKNINMAASSTTEQEEFMTETLARIYVNQGYYQKAIKAFQKLSLKYPEKSIYFARQIDDVKKLINK